jgi:phage/plasmid-like protein (TIGR03299 family)
MAHEINYNEKKGTHSFVSNTEKAWHNLGQVVDGAMTAAEAIELANLDYEVQKVKIHPALESGFGDAIPEKFATIRTDNNDYLGLVGSRYEIIQNKDAFSFFDSVVDNGEAIFETAGVLGKGERIFITAKLPEDMLVNGEKCEKYIILTNSHNGTSSIIAGFTSVRIVCNNTLQAAMNDLSNKVSIQHRVGAKDRLSEAYKVMNIASKYMLEVNEVFNQMSDTRLQDEKLKSFIERVMKPTYKEIDPEKEREQSTRFKNQVESIYDFAMTHPTQTTPAALGNVWGGYNAISGYYNYLCNYKSQEQKFNSQLFGNANSRIQKAFEESLALI